MQAAQLELIPAFHFPEPESEPELTSDDRYTPSHIIEAARRAMGRIDLDPASSDKAQKTVQAVTYYVKPNGLVLPWAGYVWLNGPFSSLVPWVDRLISAYDSGAVPGAICLTPCATSPEWARQLLKASRLICYPSRRINFLPKRKDGESNNADVLIHYLGTRPESFIEAFTPIGIVR